MQVGFGRQFGNADSTSAVRGGFRGSEGAMGRGRGRINRIGGGRADRLERDKMEGFGSRTEGWQRGGGPSHQGGQMEHTSDGQSGIGRAGRGQRGIGGSGIGPLTLVAGAKKLLQDVS